MSKLVDDYLQRKKDLILPEMGSVWKYDGNSNLKFTIVGIEDDLIMVSYSGIRGVYGWGSILDFRYYFQNHKIFRDS